MRRHPGKRKARLGLDSYRGRYLWLAAFLSGLLLVAAYVGQVLVREDAQRINENATQHARLLGALGDSSRLLHAFKAELGNFSLDPTHTDAELLHQSRKRAQAGVQRLSMQLHELGLRELQGMAAAITNDSALLTRATKELVSLRLSTPEWVPASRILSENMVPANLQFQSHLQALDSLLDDSPAEQPLRIQLLQLHNTWLGVTGELRLMVANRFGTFDADARAGMSTRLVNTGQYIDKARSQLSELLVLIGQHGDEFMLAEQAGMQAAFDSWNQSFRTLRVLLDREDWRHDIVYLRDHINPILQRLQQRISATRVQVQTKAQRQMDRVLDNSIFLAGAIAIVAAGFILFFLVGYAAFDRWLLRPMQAIAEQLKREAQGAHPEPIEAPPVAEARSLIDAFEEMHQQVQARQQRLDYMAHHDPLTGLPNRVLFRERLNSSLQKDLPAGQHVALLFLDLDRFKQINDSHGHLVGDQLLVQVAQRLRSVFRSEDTVARLSGDEFAVLLHSFSDRNELTHLAWKVVQALTPPFEIDGYTYHSSASIGLTMAPQDGNHADQLIQHADAAMYHAKANGRSGYCHFTQDMVEQSTAQLALETELHDAVAQQQLELYLQPVIDLRSGRLHARECLLRWSHPTRGVVSPDDFLATLEDIGLLQSITDWTLEQLALHGACEQGTVSINLPAKLLHKDDFAQSLETHLGAGGLDPHKLIVEITEDSFNADLVGAAQRLARLQQLGVRIALDDFGTGQSSLNHLRALPFDMLKIDRSFVEHITSNEQDATLVRAIILLARALDIEVVGEGIENEQQRQFLLGEGCQYGQGYLFGTPEPMVDQAKLQRAQNVKSPA